MRTGTASGLAIAFLSFAVLLLAVPLSDCVGALYRGPEADKQAIGRTVPFILGAMIIALFPALRRKALEELSRPIPNNRRVEVAMVALAKVVLLVGVWGALALWIWVSKGGEALANSRSNSWVDEMQAFDRAFSAHGAFHFLVLGALIAPLMEEIVFRGFLYRAWEKRWGWLPAMLMVSALFALYHPIPHAAFISSLIFVAVLRRTGTLWAPIVVHGFANAMLWPPLAGRFFTPAGPADLGDLQSWSFQFGCLTFASVFLPFYLWLASRCDSMFETRALS